MGNKGDRYERQLKGWFLEKGGGGLRIPSSGSATSQELPDIFGYLDGTKYACELKYVGKSGNYARFGKQEIKDLTKFAERWDAQAVLVGRFSQDTDFYVRPFSSAKDFEELQENDSVSIPRKKRHEYETFSQFVATSVI